MTTRLAWAMTSHELGGVTVLRRAAPVRGEWGSQTFADGMRSLTLRGRFDAQTAGRLWERISELLERGCRKLIVDASAIELSDDEPALLASVFVGRPGSYDAVVVTPRGSALADLLPAWVGVTLSLSDARRQLDTGIVRKGRNRPGPGGMLPADQRHALEVRQSLRWAARSAREGDYERALTWLTMVERMEGALAEPWQERRRSWLAARQAQLAAPPHRRPGPGAARG